MYFHVHCYLVVFLSILKYMYTLLISMTIDQQQYPNYTQLHCVLDVITQM
jgi:hypothetical protein